MSFSVMALFHSLIIKRVFHITDKAKRQGKTWRMRKINKYRQAYVKDWLPFCLTAGRVNLYQDIFGAFKIIFCYIKLILERRS